MDTTRLFASYFWFFVSQVNLQSYYRRANTKISYQLPTSCCRPFENLLHIYIKCRIHELKSVHRTLDYTYYINTESEMILIYFYFFEMNWKIVWNLKQFKADAMQCIGHCVQLNTSNGWPWLLSLLSENLMKCRIMKWERRKKKRKKSNFNECFNIPRNYTWNPNAMQWKLFMQ